MCAGLTPLLAADNDLRQQYAYAYDIQASSSGPVLNLALNETVYRSVYHPDLKDITVINSDGQEVPFLIQQQDSPRESQQTEISLPFYPLRLGSSEELSSVRVQTHADGTIINIGSHDASDGQNSRLYYIIDGSQIERGTINKIQIDWQKNIETQLIEARLEASDDLLRWHTIGQLVFSSMSFSGYNLLKDTADLHIAPSKYYRLSWQASDADIQSIRLYVQQTLIQQPQAHSVKIEVSSQQENNYFFDSQAYFPVNQVNLIPAEDNSIAEVRISSRNDESQDWQIRGKTLIYRLRIDDKSIVNDPIHLNGAAGRYWKVEVLGKKNYLNKSPRLRLSWQPQQLRFLAQGQPPFQLLFGRSHQEKAQAEQLLQDLIPSTQQLDPNTLQQAQLVNYQVICGEACLQPVVIEVAINWTRYLLWLVILLAVAGLAWMSLKLFREMNTPQD
jgi:hypothetical protein